MNGKVNEPSITDIKLVNDIIAERSTITIPRHFTKEEDGAIIQYYKEFHGDWGKIAEKIPGKTKKQIYDRYKSYLSPDIKSTEFTPEEDIQLDLLVNTMGKKWSKISKMFSGRTPLMLKNRYNRSRNKKTNITSKRTAKVYPIPIINFSTEDISSFDTLDINFASELFF